MIPQPLVKYIAGEVERAAKGFGQGGKHVLVLNDYEVANLQETFRAIGYGAAGDPGPLGALNTGDWVGQIARKLPYVEDKPGKRPNQRYDSARQLAMQIARGRISEEPKSAKSFNPNDTDTGIIR